MEWKKAPEELITFLAVRMKEVNCEPRKMFGYPAYFINGNMFAGAFQDKLFIRLSKADREKARKLQASIKSLEPMPGRPMEEYVVIPKPLYTNRAFFDEWLEKSVEYTSSLPPKKKERKR